MNDGRREQGNDWLPADHGAAGAPLKRRAARGLAWMLVDTWGAQLLGLIFFVVLARLLTVADFGLVALAVVFAIFGQLVVGLGLGDALVQRPMLTRRQMDTVFWACVIAALVLVAVTIAVAVPLATALGEPEMGPVLAVLSSTFIVTALSSVQTAVMRREMAFRQLALRRLTAVLGAGSIGVVLAISGAGVWALVAQQLAHAVIAVTVQWTVSPWRPGFQFSLADLREIVPFGRNVLGSDLLQVTSRNIDNLLVGVVLGTTSLGLYAVAYRLYDTGTQLMVNAGYALALPVFSRIQAQRERLRRTYIQVIRGLSLVTLPGYIGMALISHEAIVLVFGARWAPAAAPATLLFLAGPVFAIQLLSGALLSAAGHPEVTFRLRLITTLSNLAGFVVAVAVFRDMTAVAAAYTLRAYLLTPLVLHWLGRYAGVSWTTHLAALRTPVAATVVMAVAVTGVKVALGNAVEPWVLVSAEVATGVVVYGLAVLVLDRPLLREVGGFLGSALPRVGRAGGASRHDVGGADATGAVDA